MAGTQGKSLRLETIKIGFTDPTLNEYIEYKTHIQNIGWESEYKKGNEESGTSGKSLRLEAIRIRLTDKLAEDYDIYYRVHAQNVGWLDWAKNDEFAGTAGYSYRLEGIEIRLIKKGEEVPTNTKKTFVEKLVSYTTHVQNIGWQNYVEDGGFAGTQGKSLRLEAIEIRLTGELAKHYSVFYSVHVQNKGWRPYVKDGELAGTTGQSLRLEAICL